MSRTCDECKYDGGWHYDIDDAGNITQRRCPNWIAAEAHLEAQELAKLANENAWAAAQQIIRDAAHELPTLDANLLRDRFDQARIPTSLIGSAFTWAAKRELITKEAERVQSTEATTRHEIARWRSLVHRSAAS